MTLMDTDLTQPDAPAMTARTLMREAADAFGTSGGSFSMKDATDTLEFAVNKAIRANPQRFDPTGGTVKAAKCVADLAEIIAKMPTQTSRDEEQEALQQFSTPPHYAYLAAWAANLSAKDTVLEPSAGTGGLAVFALNAGCKVWANEISERRTRLLAGIIPPSRLFSENAEQLDNVLPDHVKPTVVLMNPPFSVSLRLHGGFPAAACLHVEQALKRLVPGGRLVAIMGRGMAPDKPTFAGWWSRIRKEYTVRANVGIPGKEYRKFGTTFDTRLIVIDKPIQGEKPGANETLVADAESVAAAVQILREVRDGRVPVEVKPAGMEGGLFGVQPEVHPTPRIPASSRVASNEPAPRQIVAEAIQVAATRAVQAAGPLNPDAIFEPYAPQRLHVAGARPHPTPLVQSAAMASALPPVPTYAPALPLELITSGTLSEAQLEAVVYAGQAHRQFLEPIVPEGKTEPVAFRKGWFCGDSTGVGKGRILGAIILDYFARGGTKSLWITATPKLIKDARRDWCDLGGRPDEIVDLGKVKAGEPIKASRGILFLTYGLLKSDWKDVKGKSRMRQVMDWVGDRFDGVIGLDESHKLKSALEKKAKRGTSRASDTALAGCELQRKLPNARVVYLSATGATEVANLAYCDRLGLWGKGTAFPDKRRFVEQIVSGGVAAMELVARDMKQMGVYCARSLSFDGVEYDRITHELSDHQRQIYDKLCEAWQIVLERFDQALELTASYMKDNGEKAVDGKRKGAAYSAFWGAHQRFFNQVLTAMQMPSALKDLKQQLADGHCAVLQLVNTNEAAQERELAKRTEDQELDDLDLTPKEMLLQLVDHCFPVVQMEEKEDADGNVRMEIVKDSAGNMVFNREAVAMKERLLDELSTVRCPEGPLEQLLNTFGPEMVAEVTGRSRRVYRKIVDGKEKVIVEPRSPMKCMAEAGEFQDDKRQILVFSDAGGTGASYHASTKVKNQRRRIHYLIQAGWVADAAVQGFGRTHRSDQVVAPLYKLVSTDLKGQKRFISSVARRLDQLGALTKGQRQAAAQGIFKFTDNLESEYAREALYQLYREIYAGKVEGMPLSLFVKQTGLKLVDQDGQLLEELPPITRFLNRLLSMQIGPQDRLFDAFAERMEAKIRKAMDEGTLDQGVETITADRVKKLSEQVVYAHPVSGAQTKHVVLNLGYKSDPWTFEQMLEGRDATGFKKIEFFARNTRSHKVYAFVECGSRTLESGKIEPHYYQIGPTTKHPIAKSELRKSESLRDKTTGAYMGERPYWKILTVDEARPLWDQQVAEVPEYSEERLDLITGAVLPIWDRLKGNPKIKRLATDEGERLLGRVVPEEELHDTLKRLGAEASAPEWKPSLIISRLKTGSHYFILSNGWKLSPCYVHGEKRYEIIGPDWTHAAMLKGDGVFFERIAWQGRFFIPVDRAQVVTAAIVKMYPVTDCRPIADKANRP